MVRMRCLMMQRNQTALLEAWFRYHGHLFGLESLTVLDNGSTDPDTVDILRRHGRAGATIAWHCKTDADFARRHAVFEEIVVGWQPENFDLALALECDEYVTVFTERGLSCRRDDIETHLAGLRGSGRRYDVVWAMRAVPDRPGYYRPMSTARTLIGSGPTTGAAHGSSELNLVVLADRRSGPDIGQVLVGLPELASVAGALGLPDGFGPGGEGDGTVPIIQRARARRFDGGAYLALHPDVAAADWPALKHYLLHGASEKRAIKARGSAP